MENNYEQKYKKALDNARLMYDAGNNDVKHIVGQLFPELAESEDEKIKHEIKVVLANTDLSQFALEYTFADMIAWLEKQGEHANFRDKAQVGDRITKNEDGVLVNLSQLKRVAKPSKEQGKQNFEMKTAEESLGIDSDTYNKIVDECIFAEQKPQRMISAEAKEAMYDKPADTVEPKFKVGDKIYLKPEYRMPNDDTPIANTVKEIRRIDDKHYRFDGSYIFIEDQDKYELVEQKPKENKGNIGGISSNSEWSVEDTFKVQRICKYLNEAKKYYADITEVRECIDWLKSLRPQNRWKPSDEQMSLLQAIINEPNNAASESCQIVLKDILEQLKKLKEGKV